MHDSSGHFVKLILQQSIFITRVIDGYDHYKGTYDIDFKNLEWQLISLTYSISQNEEEDCQSDLSIYLNGELQRKVTRFPPIAFKDPIETWINIPNKKRPAMEKPSRIGSLYLTSPLSHDEIIGIYEDGPRGVITPPKGLIFALEATQVNGVISITNHFTNGITVEVPHKPVREDTRFASILVNMVKIENIIPMFALLDLKEQNGEFVPFLCKTIIDILQNVLLLGEATQQYFSEANGFAIISHILSKSNPSNLTYKIYMRFFALGQVILLPSLQQELFDSIILNLNLWIKASPKNHLMILKHWDRAVFLKDGKMAREIRPFRWFLYVLRAFYYYEPIEDAPFLVKERCSGKELSIDESRKILSNIMLSFLNDSFSQTDYNCLVFHTITALEEKQTMSLLNLLSNLIFSRETPQNIYLFAFNSMKPLYKFLEEDHDGKVILVLNIITEIFGHLPEKREKLQKHVIDAIKLINTSILTEGILSQVISLTNRGFPELLPLCIWISLNIGENSTKMMLSTLKRDISYNCNNVSLFWSCTWILYVFHENKENIEKVIDFVLNGFRNAWIEIYDLIIAIGKGFNVPKAISQLKLMILERAVENYVEYNENQLQSIISIAKNCIFFQPIGKHSVLFNTFNSFNVKEEKSTTLKNSQIGKQKRRIIFTKPQKEKDLLNNIFMKPINPQRIVEKSQINTYQSEQIIFGLEIDQITSNNFINGFINIFQKKFLTFYSKI